MLQLLRELPEGSDLGRTLEAAAAGLVGILLADHFFEVRPDRCSGLEDRVGDWG